MAESGSSDRFNLLGHAASFAKSISVHGNSGTGYEMVDIGTSDIGTQKSSISSQYCPSYSATWDEDIEQDGKDGGSYNVSSRQLEAHYPTFTSRTTSASKNTLHSVLRFLRRSGRYGSHVSYEYANPGGFGYEERKFSGWRGGILAAATSTGIVLLINLTFTIWAGSTSKSGLRIGTLYEGECGTVRHADTWLHIAINAMGTILLRASDFTMQCLSAPTRSEIDVAHSKGRYLDIGLPSLNNLNGWKKKVMFTFLVLSTLPLHFLWNSAVFTTTQNLDYNVFVVAPSFLNQSTVDCIQNVTLFNTGVLATDYYQTPLQYGTASNGTAVSNDNQFWQADVCNISKALLANSTAGTLSRLSNEECINAYGPGNGNMKG